MQQDESHFLPGEEILNVRCDIARYPNVQSPRKCIRMDYCFGRWVTPSKSVMRRVITCKRSKMQSFSWSSRRIQVLSAIWCLLVLIFLFSLYHLKSFNLDRGFRANMSGDNFSNPVKEGIVNYLASNLVVSYRVMGNYGSFSNMHRATLQNDGKNYVPPGNPEKWSIYFNNLHLLEYDHFSLFDSRKLSSCDFTLTHVDGGLYQLTPTADFKGIAPGQSVVVSFKALTTVSRCYILPRWYAQAPGQSAAVIKSTDDESAKYVEDFDRAEQWKRSSQDYHNPFTLETRYQEYFITDLTTAPLRVIPTPLIHEIDEMKTVNLGSGSWVVCNDVRSLRNEVRRFSDIFGVKLLPETEPCPPSSVVKFEIGDIKGVPKSDEAYQIVVDAEKQLIEVTSQGSAGAFYAVQSLLSLAETQQGKLRYTLPSLMIKDVPRFAYRGFHIDVGRNFIPADDLIGIIEAAALYKLNTLHLHLTDDEGWRIEIEGLPELTQVGAIRRHTDDEHEAIFPALGSGPGSDNSGSGFYSTSDYTRILVAAEANHVQVIPEIDTPGHSHAAIKAMQARYRRLIDEGKRLEAEEFLLHDPDDKSDAMSVQHFRRNGINPCMESTYRFVDHVIKAMMRMHSAIQPLTTIHMGGDEVAGRSWSQSPICKKFMRDNKGGFPQRPNELQEFFMRRVSEICRKHELAMGVWEDGAFKMPSNDPYDKSLMHGTDIVGYAWNNGWKGDTVKRAHKMANAGYKVVMSQATHLYFDHPQEPDPEERGLVWATRYIDDKKVFDFRPDDLYGNAKYDRNGAPYSADETERIRKSHPVLKKPENVIGVQIQVWSELLRDVTAFHEMIFPRLLPFAERAWHRSEWEAGDSRAMRDLRNREWELFANVVGYKELPRLRERGVRYRVPPPGVKVSNGSFDVCSLYPGLKYFCRPISALQPRSDWKEIKSGQPISMLGERYEFMTSDGQRHSRVVSLT